MTMNNEQLSDTNRLLFDYVIADILSQVCRNNPNYCVKHVIGEDSFQVATWKAMVRYEAKALEHMSGKRLDRHKLASCICGAIIEIQPLEGQNGAKIPKNANEIVALYVGLSVVKVFMMYDVLRDAPMDRRDEIRRYLKNKFEMKLPSLEENVCDTQEYHRNIINALYWSHGKCDISRKECFRYDIWAYAKIFYHLELFNKDYLKNFYLEYARRLGCD